MPDPFAPRVPRVDHPPVPDRRPGTEGERLQAAGVLSRHTPFAVPTTLEGLTLHHLEEADEQDFALAHLAARVGTQRCHPLDVPVILMHTLAPALGSDECPGWVYGVAAIVGALAQSARERELRGLFRERLGEMGFDLGRVPGDLLAQIDGAAQQAAIQEQDEKDGDGGPYVQITRRKIARRRRLALGLPIDPQAARKDREALDGLLEVVRLHLAHMIAVDKRRALRRAREAVEGQTRQRRVR